MSDINVGKIIQQKRKGLGITQEKLAELSDLSVNYISKIERLDDQNISLKSLAAIAKALDVTVPELLVNTPFEVNQSASTNTETRLLAKKLQLLPSSTQIKLIRSFEKIVDTFIEA